MMIGGIGDNITKELLHSAFIPFGDISKIDLPLVSFKDKMVNKGFAFIEFETAEDAFNAVDNMHLADLLGNVLKVNFSRAPAKTNKQMR